jgi:hypothetical protein
VEDVALGMASVYRTVEAALPPRLPRAGGSVLRRFRDLIARVQPFDLVIEGETAAGERVKVSDSSMCDRHDAIAGTIRYFADRYGTARGAIEGTSLPFELIRRYATESEPTVEFRAGRRRAQLVLVSTIEYSGFVLSRERRPMDGRFPERYADAARAALARALLAGATEHPAQRAISRAAARLDEYWRRSGGALPRAAPDAVAARISAQLASVSSWEEFMGADVTLNVEEAVPDHAARMLDTLPTSAQVLGDRVPLSYEVEGSAGVVRLRLREKQALRATERDLPTVDRPLRFSVVRGRHEVLRSDSLDALRRGLRGLRSKPGSRGRRR